MTSLVSLFPSVLAAGASVLIGTRGLVHVWGRNDMNTRQLLGISWVVHDPDGRLVEQYSDWSLFGAAPGVEHEFIGGRFDIDKLGTWKISIGLYMNHEDPVLVDSYFGDLCSVTAEFAGTITKKELEYDETRGAIPVATRIPIGQRGLVHIWGRNDTSLPQKLGISWIVKDPYGHIVEDYSDWSAFDAKPGVEHEFIGGRFDLDKVGTYTLEVNLFMNPHNPVIVDSYEGDLCATTTEVPPVFRFIQHTIHPAAYVYEDETEVCVLEFPLTPDQLPFTQWGGLKIAEAFANAIEAEGNSILEQKVYEDTTPALWTNYRVEIKAAVASEGGTAIGVWPWLIPIGAKLLTLPWGKIIIGALSVLGIWVVGWVIDRLIKSVDRVIHRPLSLTNEIIDSLGRKDLIPLILYLAQKIDYEVSPEELEVLSDDGLRALLKELRDWKAREEMEWWPLALVGGLGVLGVGGAVALAMAKPGKER